MPTIPPFDAASGTLVCPRVTAVSAKTAAATVDAPVTRTVVLVASGSPKWGWTAPARSFYCSPLFLLSRCYAEALAASPNTQWLILSPLHRVVEPGTRLQPFVRANLTLRHPAVRRAWGKAVAQQLAFRCQCETAVRLIVLADDNYLAFASPEHRAGLEQYGTRFEIETPLHGLGLGRRLRWLAQVAAAVIAAAVFPVQSTRKEQNA